MQIKTFKAPDLAGALARARNELGADALVLATNQIRGPLGLASVEITVGVDRAVSDGTRDHELERLALEVGRLKTHLAAPVADSAPATEASTSPTAPARVTQAPPARVPDRTRRIPRHFDPTDIVGSEPLAAPRDLRLVSPPAHGDPTPVRTAGPDLVRHLIAPMLRRESSAAPAPISFLESVTHPTLRSTLEVLLGSGLSVELAERFATIAAQALTSPDTDTESVARATEQGVAGLLPFAELPVDSRVLFVVGPPGSGKTTTVAKLAARATIAASRTVTLGQADLDRIGAGIQAEVYARHIGAQIADLGNADDLRRTLDSLGAHGSLIVDTAGIGAADTSRLATLKAMRACVPEAQVVLLIPAGLHRDEARRVLQRFRELQPTRVGLARVDDGGRLGDLVTVLAGADLPLAFMTNGHRVPDDLEQATPRALAARVLRSGFHAQQEREMH